MTAQWLQREAQSLRQLRPMGINRALAITRRMFRSFGVDYYDRQRLLRGFPVRVLHPVLDQRLFGCKHCDWCYQLEHGYGR